MLCSSAHSARAVDANLRTIRTKISSKVKEQADRLIVSLVNNSQVTAQDISNRLARDTVTGLKEVFVITKEQTIVRIFPN